MSKSKQPEGTVHKVVPGQTAWPFTTPQSPVEPASNPVEITSPMPAQPGEPSVWDDCEQDARTLRRARMLPAKGPLTAQLIEEVRASVRRFKDQFGVSSKTLAAEIGSSPTVISQFLSRAYTGDNERVARELNAAIERLARIEEAKLPDDWFPFQQATKMLRVVDEAVAAKKMGLVTAPSGACKTSTVEAARLRNPGAVVIRANITGRSSGRILRAIAREIGTRVVGASDEIFDRIISELKGTSRPIIVDEAQRLGDTGVEVLRDIHDVAGVPVVFFATDDFSLMVDDTAKWLGQVRRRITHRFHAGADLPGSQLSFDPSGGQKVSAKKRPMFTADELTQWMAKQGLRISDDGIQCLAVLANFAELGCLGFCVEVVRRALKHKDYRDRTKPLDAQILQAVAAQVHGVRFNTTFSGSRAKEITAIVAAA